MTNAEKYKEVFGMPADPSNCPTSDCIVCPCAKRNPDNAFSCIAASTYEWWDEEYKEAEDDSDNTNDISLL